MRKAYITPIDGATRAARAALRSIDRAAIVSVGSRYAYDPMAGRTDVVTTILLRSADVMPEVVDALGPAATVTGARHVELHRAA